MYTVNFVDEKHLLFTFTVRSLMARLPDAEEDDDDRNVAALLIEVPSGKVLSRTEWRTRDHDRYLWPLEHGRFLLRVRSKLSVIDPLRNFEKGDAWLRQGFLSLERPIGYVAVSPSGNLLGVETLPLRKKKLTGAAASADALAATVPGYRPPPSIRVEGRSPVQIYFFRLKTDGPDWNGKLIAQTAGQVGAPNLINLPTTGDGFLDIKQDKGATWLFDFVSHTGKRLELAAYDTSCAPRPYFISRSEFVAFGCRGTTEKQQLSYFNLKGEEPWLSVLQGTQVSPSIIGAPGAGRFAMSRTLVAGTVFDTETLTAADLTAQEISVMQNYDGRVLLKVQATPIQRAGQNFDLSPSGEKFAVLRGANLEVYSLPTLNGKDLKAVKLAEGMTPEANDAPIRMGGVEVALKVAEKEEAKQTKESVAPNAADPASPAAARAEAPVQALPAGEGVQTSANKPVVEALGDPQVGERKVPSLYTAEHPREKGDPKPSVPGTPQ